MTQAATDIDARPLPAGWKWVKLGDVSGIKNGYAFDSGRFSNDTGFPLIRIRDLKTDDPSVFFQGDYSDEYLVNPGELLIGMDGEFRCYRWAGPIALQNQRVCRLLPNMSLIDPDFLYYSINDYLVAIENQTAFTTVKHISSRQIQNINLPLPPLEEQKRIAAVLNEQMAAVEKAKKAAEERLEAAKALPAAYLREVFPDSEDGLLDGWDLVKFSEVCTAKSGLSRKLSSEDIGVPVIISGNIKDNMLDMTEIKYWHIDDPQGADTSSYFLNDGDILLNFINSVAQIGKSCIYRDIGRPAIYTTNIFRVKCTEKVVPEFIHVFMMSNWFKRRISDLTQRAVNQASFTRKDLDNTNVPLPSLEIQQLIPVEIGDKLAGVQLAERTIRQELETIEAMPAAILRKAFLGEL